LDTQVDLVALVVPLLLVVEEVVLVRMVKTNQEGKMKVVLVVMVLMLHQHLMIQHLHQQLIRYIQVGVQMVVIHM
jgi:hypothetical protein